MGKNFLINIFYYSIFFPFFSFIPINSDLQPVFVVIIILLIVFKDFSFNRKDLVLFTIGILSLCYINPFSSTILPFKGAGAYFSLCISLFFLVINGKVFNIKIFESVLKQSIIIYFIGSILFYIFPDTFSSFQLHFVRSVNTLDQGFNYRGISTFFTEPGLFGAHMIGLLLILMNLFKYKIIKLKEYYFYTFLIIVMIFLSKSGMGYLYLTLCLFYIMFNNLNKIKLLNIIVLVGLIFLLLYKFNFSLENNRGLVALNSLSNYNDLSDISILKRIFDFITGIYILFKHPFGMGINFTQHDLLGVINSNNFLRGFYGNIMEFGFVSSISLLFAYFGFLFVILLGYLIRYYKPSFINLSFALILLSFSFSAAYPIIWLLLSLDSLLKKYYPFDKVNYKFK